MISYLRLPLANLALLSRTYNPRSSSSIPKYAHFLYRLCLPVFISWFGRCLAVVWTGCIRRRKVRNPSRRAADLASDWLCESGGKNYCGAKGATVFANFVKSCGRWRHLWNWLSSSTSWVSIPCYEGSSVFTGYHIRDTSMVLKKIVICRTWELK